MRQAARVALVDAEPAVLLLSGADPLEGGDTGFWFLPGGGVEREESLEDAARREVWEETGGLIGELGPVVWRRRTAFVFEGRAYEQDESFFVIATPRFDVRPTALTEVEVRTTTGWRWWSVDDLGRTTETVYPPLLALLVGSWLEAGPAATPQWID